MPRYKLKLKQLDFVSLVDDPAQPNAKCLLIKRRDAQRSDVEGTARLVKTVDELGLAFFWAFTSTNEDGSDHYDLHGDQVVADDTMIKAAMSFMENGGAVDEMHDSEQTGHVVFAMPMTPEIAKAFGVETKTSGLMLALKPSADAMAKLKAGEYRAVSIAGLGEREAVEKLGAGKVLKASLYTNEVDGHQHSVRVYEDGTMWVDSATSEGAEMCHSHGIVFEGGALTILADSGHTHELADGQPGLAIVPVGAIVIQASVSPTRNAPAPTPAAVAPRTKSTRSAAAPQGDNTMKLIVLTEAQNAHYSKLAASEQEAYLNKSASDRDADIEKALAADPIVFKGEKTGIEVRKSQGDFAMKIAKQAEEGAVTMAKQADEIAKRDVEIKKTRIRKLATELFANRSSGTPETLDFIVEKLEDNADALAVLKGLVATSKVGQPAPGIGGTEQAADEPAQKKLDAVIAKHATDNKLSIPAATKAVLATAEGRALYHEANP